jgi:hypothetical protein
MTDTNWEQSVVYRLTDKEDPCSIEVITDSKKALSITKKANLLLSTGEHVQVDRHHGYSFRLHPHKLDVTC